MPWTHDTKPFVYLKGPLILSLESVFFHWQRYPRRRVAPAPPPLHETARPRELEQPYRKGHGHMFRFPLTRRGVVLGYWEPAGAGALEEDESSYLLAAVEGAMVPGITATEISSWSRGRKRWLERVREWIRARWEAVASTEIAIELGFQPEPEEEQYADVIPWDGKIYDLEDARVQLGEDSA